MQRGGPRDPGDRVVELTNICAKQQLLQERRPYNSGDGLVEAVTK